MPMLKSSNYEPSSALLVGRVNVGKSTLFNRILNRYRALTSPEGGTTRDLNRALTIWRGKTFWIVDSGGFNRQVKDAVGQASQNHWQRAWQTAAVILLVVDGQTGLTPEDRELARQVRQGQAHCILVINKLDNPAKRAQAASLSLGFPDTVMVSAKTGSGVGDLLDLIVPHLDSAVEPEPNLKLAIMGQTNVGKSSLFNALLKSERSLVLPTPHTTRDRVHDYLEAEGITIELIDTAGLRRQHLRAPTAEKQSAQQSLSALKRVTMALVTIDGSVAPSWQDQHIGQLVVESRLSAIVLLTKADLVALTARAGIETRLARWLPMLAWAPTHWVSAVTGEGIAKLLPLVKQIGANWHRQLTGPEIESFWQYLKRHSTTRQLPLANFEQVNICPPMFKLVLRQKANPPRAIGDWTASQLRKKFDFAGSPLIVRLESSRQAK